MKFQISVNFDLGFPDDYADQFVTDPTGDQLDSFLCALQAAWAFTQNRNNYGIPREVDMLEGWIVDPTLVQEL